MSDIHRTYKALAFYCALAVESLQSSACRLISKEIIFHFPCSTIFFPTYFLNVDMPPDTILGPFLFTCNNFNLSCGFNSQALANNFQIHTSSPYSFHNLQAEILTGSRDLSPHGCAASTLNFICAKLNPFFSLKSAPPLSKLS